MHNVAHDHIDRSMVEAIAQIGESMGIRTVAERVDSAEVLARLADIGIQYAQGHYIGAPQPVAILDSLLTEDSSQVRLLA
jgi:EAL domain-containing protein (putative c-di-GMP-specific phosphodiesterase class I)